MKTCATLFSGIGGADLGLTQAGYKPVYAVEWNQGALDIFNANHDIETTIHADVSSVDYQSLPQVDLLWASPVCCSFSAANHNQGEVSDDIRSAYAVVKAARQARSVIIENVPAYQNSSSYQVIKDLLSLDGFIYNREIICNAARFGNPSSRIRFYSVFSKDKFIPTLIMEDKTPSWLIEIIENISHWERSKLTKNQIKVIQEKKLDQAAYPHEPYAIERCGYYGEPKVIKPTQLFPCLKSHSGHDGKNPKAGYGKIGSYRSQYDFVHAGSSYTLTPKLMGVLMGFPIDYNWGENKAQAVAGIGNAVVPKMATVIAGLLN